MEEEVYLGGVGRSEKGRATMVRSNRYSDFPLPESPRMPWNASRAIEERVALFSVPH